EAAFHLLTNLAYLLMAMVSVLIFPAIILREDLGWYRVLLVDLPLFMGATGVISRYYVHSQREIYSDWKSRIRYLPCVLALGMGISLNNARGVIQALRGHETEFKRTPKYRVVSRGDGWWQKDYAVRKNLTSFLELGLGVYLMAAMVYSMGKGLYFPIPFLILFASGFFYVGGMSLFQGLWAQVRSQAPDVEVAAAD
ncbi:MAG: glycosyl transferase family 2, partial [Candidatus Latescibacteria bacterium]|nr:glycosyl transferase family 2 [Candidatus Latescibacterota bacterium]